MAILTRHWGLDVALVCSLALLAAYLYMTRNFKYWVKKGVVEIPPIPFFGNFLDCCLFRASPPVYLGSMYKRAKSLPYAGFYVFDKPVLLLRDPSLIKKVLIKDFDSFANRYVGTHEGDSIAAKNMFLLKTPDWKNVRSKVSPIFTSGKLKRMFQLMLAVGQKLVIHLDNLRLQGNGEMIEIKDISTKFTMDVITTCAFGLEGNCLNDPESLFRKYSIKIFGLATTMRCVEFAAFFFAQNLVHLLKLNFFSKEASEFMRVIFTDTITRRLESNTRRDDLIDLLIQVKKSQDQSDDPDDFKLEGDGLIGLAAAFLAGGYETSATTITFSLYELALNPDIQSKLREEIIAALEESGGEVTYELVMNLPYLDMVVSESLRKYPSLPFLDRVATSDYKVPGSDLVIEKGTTLYVPLLGLHYDPEYFPEPENFDPERFSDENRKKMPSCVYMPFGDGPRNCIGSRFGLMTSKLGILKFILNYELSPCAQTTIPVRYDTKTILFKSVGGLYLHARPITTITNSSS